MDVRGWVMRDDELSNSGRGPPTRGLPVPVDSRLPLRRLSWLLSESAEPSEPVGELMMSLRSGMMLSLTGRKNAGRAGGEYELDRSPSGSELLFVSYARGAALTSTEPLLSEEEDGTQDGDSDAVGGAL